MPNFNSFYEESQKCLIFKVVKYTMIISSDPPFKEGHARFPMVTCIPLSNWWFENTSVFLFCKCMLDMPLHKWKVTWNYVSSPFKTHPWVESLMLKTFIHKFLKPLKNNIITSYKGWVKKGLTTQFFLHGSCLRMKNIKVGKNLVMLSLRNDMIFNEV